MPFGRRRPPAERYSAPIHFNRKDRPVNNNNKPFIILAGIIGAVFVTSFVIRFVVLSQMGLPGSWMLMFLLPAGGIGLLVVLFRLGLLHSMTQSFSAFGSAPSVPSKSQRLQEIENLRASGAMSEDEYTAERARIISSI
jgi:4-amino-4-deoxy-L-arabinose transferase-like glycosyltransferase